MSLGKRDDPGNGKRADERERNVSNRAGIRTERRQSWIKTIRDEKKKERKREKEQKCRDGSGIYGLSLNDLWRLKISERIRFTPPY